MTKISGLTALTGANLATTDVVDVVDVSDTTMAASGTNKKMTVVELVVGLDAQTHAKGILDATVATPVAAADTVVMFGRKIAGRALPAFVGPSGLDSAVQPSLARNAVAQWMTAPGSVSIFSDGIQGPISTGTATLANTATTNIFTWMKRVDYLVTTAATTAVAGFRSSPVMFGRGNAAGLGGFMYVQRWGPATGVATATNRAFVGLANSTVAPTDVQPSTLVDMCGMGWDAADVNIQFMHNDNVGTATKIDLGATLPVPTADRSKVYELAMFCAPNGTTINYEVQDLATGAIVTGAVTTDIPANTVLLAPRGWMSVGGTSSVIGIALMSLYVETDY